MMEFIIKSTVSLTFMYLIYFIFLRNIKAFEFNRFFLLFSILFSLTIPFINIKTSIIVPINQDFKNLSSPINDLIILNKEVGGSSIREFTPKAIILSLYLIISFFLLIRLITNLYKIIKKIKVSTKVYNSIILVEGKTLVHSFFKYIFVDKKDYQKGIIDEKLILHEKAHCNQFHSIDILIIEIIKILLWFNPVIWVLKRDIQLNHEYLADSFVLLNHQKDSYKNVILNLVLRNNTTYLASNFNLSLTKRRLVMISKKNTKRKLIIRKIIVLPFVFILVISFSFSQKNFSEAKIANYENEWWHPLLKRHNIETKAFNNFSNIFEAGSTNTIIGRIVKLEDAVFLIKTDPESYTLIRSPLAFHYLDKNIIEGDIGLIETYCLMQKETELLNSIEVRSFKFKITDNSKITLEGDELISIQKK